MYDSAFAALYYPWVEVENPAPVNGDTSIMVPPLRAGGAASR
jgi:hypothetical protein